MSRFHAAKIASQNLTDNGSESGTRCKLRVNGLDSLAFSRSSSQVEKALDGTAYKVGFLSGVKGKNFSISVETLKQSVFEILKTELDAADAAGALVRVIATDGATGDVDLDCLFVDMKISGDFFSDLVRGVEFFFVAQQNHA